MADISADAIPVVPVFMPNSVEHRRQIANAVNGLIKEHGLHIRFDTVQAHLTKGETSAPALEALAGSTVKLWHFDDTSEEELCFSAVLPHRMVEGATIIPNVRWTPTNTDTGPVVWGIEYFAANMDEPFNLSSTGAVKTSTAVGTIQGTRAAFATLSGLAVSSVIVGRVYRHATSSADTYSGDAALISVDFLIQVDGRGSQDAYTKYVVTTD